MPNETLSGEYTFGRFRVDAPSRALWVDGELAPIGSRAFDVLVALIERRERAVSRDELFEVVWPDVVVSPNNLDVQVWAVRKLLGPQAIATIPGRGYRFTASLDGADGADRAVARPAVAPDPPPRRALPASAQRLIGRVGDVQAVGALLAKHRLVTITGAGGMGKTTLAHHVAGAQLSANTGMDVAWVELAGLTEPAFLVGVIAGVIGVSPGAEAPLRMLIKALASFEMLIVLDNAEHLVDEVASVIQALLDGAPGVRLLVTSQVPLKVTGERVHRLGALSVPEATVPLAEALEHGALALFVERVHALDMGFALEERNVAAAIDICRQLDGLPLAIELAAARVPALGLQGVRERLGERLRLLSTGARTAPARHQTLRAALEWSHSLLSGDEQVVFRRLGVFAGGFSLEMAEQVAGEEGREAWAVIDALCALIDRSLIAVDGADPPRYRLLESARALALERLFISGEEPGLRRRHAEVVLARFQRVRAELRCGRIGHDDACAALEPDLDNARDAFEWALRHESQIAVDLAVPMTLALRRVRYDEVRHVWEATEAHAANAPPASRAAWTVGRCMFISHRKPALTRELAPLALALYRELGDPVGLYEALYCRCAIDFSLGAAERKRALDEMRALEQPDWPAQITFLRREAEYNDEMRTLEEPDAPAPISHWRRDTAGQGPPPMSAGLRAARESLQLHRQRGSADGYYYALMKVAYGELVAGFIDDSIRHGIELVESCSAKPVHAPTMALVHQNLASALLINGAVAEARVQCELAWPLTLRFEMHVEDLVGTLAMIALVEGRMRTAAILRGYSEAVWVRDRSPRGPIEQYMADEIDRVAGERLGDAEFKRLCAAGETLRDEQIPALAFATEDSA